jgi:predicted Na+-dependent transporter
MTAPCFLVMIVPVSVLMTVIVSVIVPVLMTVIVPELMTVIVPELMTVIVPVSVVMIMHIFISTVSYNGNPGACDAVTLVRIYLQSPSLHIELLQAALQDLTTDTKVKHRPQVHVPADS